MPVRGHCEEACVLCLLTLSPDFRVVVWSLLPSLPLTTSPMKFPLIDRNSGSHTSWCECVNLSESSHCRPPDKALPGYLEPDPVLSKKLALENKRWSRASETFLVSRCGIEASERRRFLGRGSGTTLRLKPVVQRIPPGEEHFVDQECRFWSRLLSRLKFLALLVVVTESFNSVPGSSNISGTTCAPTSGT